MPRPFFNKLILSSTIQQKRLRIPDSFAKRFKDQLSVAVALTVLDGHAWRVGLNRVDENIWLEEGWQDFVERYSICIGYFLVFRYDGNSAFTVYMFNLSRDSEINSQSSVKIETPAHSIKYNLFDDFEDEDSGVTLPSYLTPVPESPPDKVYDPTPIQSFYSSAPKGEETSENQGSKKKRKSQPSVQREPATHHQGTGKRYKYYKNASTRKSTVASEARKKILDIAKGFVPTNPFCRVVLRPSYVYKGCIMYLPTCFAEKHLSGVSGFIKLKLTEGKQWPVRCLYYKGKAKLSQGWWDFASENNLAEGDVCVFELLETTDILLKVTVFRVTEIQ